MHGGEIQIHQQIQESETMMSSHGTRGDAVEWDAGRVCFKFCRRLKAL